jgi:hypothetical protein
LIAKHCQCLAVQSDDEQSVPRNVLF